MTTGSRLEPIRRVHLRDFAIAPSCLGFGCASLGSRVGARAGLRALAEAYDGGVTWFDVAPAYGGGEAELILAAFLRGRRDRVAVTTKVGLAPPRRAGALRMAATLLRPAVGAFGGLRRAYRRAAATRNRRLPIDGALVESSLAASLRRLGTDRVDVYALHDPEPDEVRRDDVLRALERVVARGQARRIAVAGPLAACRAALDAGAPYSLVQMDCGSAASATAAVARSSQDLVLHSVFGVGATRERLVAALASDGGKLRLVAERGYGHDPATAAGDLLLDAAFAANPSGIVLCSLFGSGHLRAALARADRLRPEALDLVREIGG